MSASQPGGQGRDGAQWEDENEGWGLLNQKKKQSYRGQQREWGGREVEKEGEERHIEAIGKKIKGERIILNKLFLISPSPTSLIPIPVSLPGQSCD